MTYDLASRQQRVLCAAPPSQPHPQEETSSAAAAPAAVADAPHATIKVDIAAAADAAFEAAAASEAAAAEEVMAAAEYAGGTPDGDAAAPAHETPTHASPRRGASLSGSAV